MDTTMTTPVLATKIDVFDPCIPFAIVLPKNDIKKYASKCIITNQGFSSCQWERQGKVFVGTNEIQIPDICFSKCGETISYRAFQVFLDDDLHMQTSSLIVPFQNPFFLGKVLLHGFDENMEKVCEKCIIFSGGIGF